MTHTPLNKVCSEFTAGSGKVDASNLSVKFENDYKEIHDRYLKFVERELRHLRKSYAKYSKEIVRIKAQIKKVGPSKTDGFIAYGSTTAAYRFGPNGNRAAIIYISDKPQNVVYEMLRKIMAGILAKKIKAAPKVLAFSLGDQVIVMERARGKSVASIKTKPRFSDNKIKNLIETVISAYAQNLTVDYYPDNLIYDSKTGFSIVDLCLRKKSSPPLYQEIMSLRAMLVNWRFGVGKKSDSLKMGVRILKIVKRRFPKLLKDFRRADQNTILSIGNTNVRVEFSRMNLTDQKILREARRTIKTL